MDYNLKLSQLAGLATAFASEIENDKTLSKGEKFLHLQRFFRDIAKLSKTFDKTKKELETIIKNQAYDTGDGKSQELEVEGVIGQVKYDQANTIWLDDKQFQELKRMINNKENITGVKGTIKKFSGAEIEGVKYAMKKAYKEELTNLLNSYGL